jgi:hypothetical protein
VDPSLHGSPGLILVILQSEDKRETADLLSLPISLEHNSISDRWAYLECLIRCPVVTAHHLKMTMGVLVVRSPSRLGMVDGLALEA